MVVAAFAMAMVVATLNRDAVREGVPAILAIAGLATFFAMAWAASSCS